MAAQLMPGANTTAQWFADAYPGVATTPDGGVLHTTEGFSWPAYSGGAVAPTLTFLPLITEGILNVRQHFPIGMSARALKNAAGGVQTNTLDVVQIELVGTCDPTYRTAWSGYRAGVDYVYWPDAPEWLLREVAQRLTWLEEQHGIPATSPVTGRWTAYPASAGNGPQRLSNDAWNTLRGWVGHQHVPENDHGDPGALDFPTIARLAHDLRAAPQIPQPNRTADMFMVTYFQEVWLIGSDGMKERLLDPDVVHAYQAGGVTMATGLSNVVVKKVLAINSTRPATV